MTAMVQVALATDLAEAEDIQEALKDAGIESELEAGEEYPLRVLVPGDSIEAAQDVLDAMADLDDLPPDA